MTRTEARQLALGYAWGTGATAASPDLRAGDVLFAEAFADAYVEWSGNAVDVEHAWETWQASGGHAVSVSEPLASQGQDCRASHCPPGTDGRCAWPRCAE